jgi:small subunit ribosomal protein S17e
MGRIKSLMIKKAAKQLLDGEHSFNESFEHNKKILSNTMPSKPIRNKIAGYIGRLIRMKNAPPKVIKKEEFPVNEYYQ